jgi:DNA-directed RNA polymerase specialized sigma subunit
MEVEEARLWREFAKTRDQALRERLVERNMPFAKRLALR